MAIYSEIVGATNFKRKQLTQSGEGLGRFVISVPNEIKEKLIDGEEFETVIELNDDLLKTSIKQRSNLKNWGISIEVNNGTTLLVGSVIGVINQKRVGDIEQTIMTCLMSNGSYLVVSVEYDVVNKTFNASLTSRGLAGGGAKAVIFNNVEFSGATLPKATLNVSEEEFGLIVGQDDVNIILNLANGDTLVLHRESYDGDGARFICSVGHINTEFIMTLYFATFVKVGSNIVGEVYEIDVFESNVEIPSGVEPIKLATAKIFGEYFEVGGGIEATVDEANKTIDIVVG